MKYWICIISAVWLGGCRGDNICNEAVGICGAGQEVADDLCRGKEQAYAQCIVDHDLCSPTIAAKCANASTGGEDASSGIGLKLVDTEYRMVYGEMELIVELELSNVSEQTPVPISRALFSLEDHDKHLRHFTGGTCEGGDALVAGGKTSCTLSHSSSDPFTAKRIRYLDPLQRGAMVELPDQPEGCLMMPEDNLAACSDGCSNDGDKFIDCDDFDCCDVRSDCPASSACAR